MSGMMSSIMGSKTSLADPRANSDTMRLGPIPEQGMDANPLASVASTIFGTARHVPAMASGVQSSDMASSAMMSSYAFGTTRGAEPQYGKMPGLPAAQPVGEANPLASVMSSVFGSKVQSDPLATMPGGRPANAQDPMASANPLAAMGSVMFGSKTYADPTASSPMFSAVGVPGRGVPAPATFGGPPMIQVGNGTKIESQKQCLCC